MAYSWDSHVVAGTSLISHVRRQTAQKISSAGVMDVCVRYAWIKSIVSEMHNAFMTASINSMHQQCLSAGPT